MLKILLISFLLIFLNNLFGYTFSFPGLFNQDEKQVEAKYLACWADPRITYSPTVLCNVFSNKEELLADKQKELDSRSTMTREAISHGVFLVEEVSFSIERKNTCKDKLIVILED